MDVSLQYLSSTLYLASPMFTTLGKCRDRCTCDMRNDIKGWKDTQFDRSPPSPPTLRFKHLDQEICQGSLYGINLMPVVPCRPLASVKQATMRGLVPP